MITGWQAVTGMMAILFGFGIIYNFIVAKIEEHPGHGLVSFLVVGGVAVTLVGMGVIDLVVDWNAGQLGLACFAFSGAPMVIGSVSRYLKRLKRERELIDQYTRRILG